MRPLATAALVGLVGPLTLAVPRSVYTTLDPDECRTLTVEYESGSSTQACPGTAGFSLLVHEDDGRQTVDVVAPDGTGHALDFGSTVTPAFSSLGPRAEWRVEGTGRAARPVALIVRVNAQEDPDRPSRTTSYLAVARVSPSGACVTDRIGPSVDANARARRAADRAAGQPCRPMSRTE